MSSYSLVNPCRVCVCGSFVTKPASRFSLCVYTIVSPPICCVRHTPDAQQFEQICMWAKIISEADRMHNVSQQSCRATTLSDHARWVLQNRMSADFVSEVEGVLGEYEGDLELNQVKSPRPGVEGPHFPARGLLKIINHGIQVSHTSLLQSRQCTTVPGSRPQLIWDGKLPRSLTV